MMPTQTNMISLLLVVPLVAGVLSLMFIKNRPLCRLIGTTSFVANLVLAVFFLLQAHTNAPGFDVLVSQSGSWPAPWGISLVFDHLSGLMILATSIVGLGTYIYGFSMLPENIEARYYHPLTQFIVLGVTLSFMTGDVFNLFVAFEVMLMASYALLTLGSTKKQLAHAYKYVLLNLLASTIFVMGAGMIYGMTGTLNMADLARMANESALYEKFTLAGMDATAAGLKPVPPGFTALAVLMLMVFATKAAVFPLWFWLPDTYWTAPAPILAFFGGVLTKVGVYAIARLFSLIFIPADSFDGAPVLSNILLIGAGCTMVMGAFGALAYDQVRRILCMALIASVGYMIFGAALNTASSLAGTVFYMTQSMIVTAVMFMCCGLMEKHAGSDDLTRIGGLLKKDTYLGVVTFIAAMSLAGLPPLSGFFGKLLIVREGWMDGQTIVTIASLVAGALTILAVLRVWGLGMWGPSDAATESDPSQVRREQRPAYAAITGLTAVAVLMGFVAQPLMNYSEQAGIQLASPNAYIEAVLGPQGVEQIKQATDTLERAGYTQFTEVAGVPRP